MAQVRALSFSRSILPLVAPPFQRLVGVRSVQSFASGAVRPLDQKIALVGGRSYHEDGSRKEIPHTHWWATGFSSVAVLGGSALLFTSTASHSSEDMFVYERETGIRFPKQIQTPPFVESRWKGPRPGFVYKTGSQGLGYYLDTYRRGEGYTDIPEGGVTQHLVGVGMRCMLQRCDIHLARAYAIGLYLDRSYLAGFEPAKLTDPRLRKTLTLVMAREVKGGHIGKGFDRTLIPKMRQKTGKKQGPGKEALKVFNTAFNRCGTLGVGAEVAFVFGGDDSVAIYIEGVPAARIESAELCEAVMEMYVGDKPVGPQIKANMVQGYDETYQTGLGKVDVPAGTLPTPIAT